jgi:hypothetical protein
MKFVKRGAVCLILVSLCAPYGARAQSQASQAEVKALITEYVGAFNAKDLTRMHALYDPKALPCITPENKDFYDGALESEWRDPIPANYTFRVSAVNESNLKALESLGSFPVKPAQELQIDYQQRDDSGSTILYLVRENGRLLIDEGCANEQALKKFHDEAPARAKFLAQEKALAAAIKEPLRSQLMALLHEHMRSEAIKRYKEASGQDYRTAIFVIDVLAHETP